MGIKIYVDAASNLFPELIRKRGLDITVVNMHLFVEDKEYNCYDDDIDIKKFSKSFYTDLKEGKSVRTSLINPDEYFNYFKKDIDNGHQIICFTMAKGISGTYQSACIARDMIKDETGKDDIYVVDSATAGFGEGRQAIHAARWVKKGKSFEEVIKEAEEYKWKVRSEFFVDNVKYLVKTGRVSSIVARIANVLRIKVLLYGSYESKIEMTGKVAGRNLAIKKLAKQCIEHIVDADKQIVYISHCDCYDDAFELASILKKNGITNVEIHPYDVITGSHIGPGSLAMFYVGKDRYLK